MKKLMEVIVQIKVFACLIFTAIMIVNLILSLFFETQTITIAYVWQSLGISIVCAMLHFVAFSENVIKKMAYPKRLCLFGIPFLAVLSGCVLLFEWFPVADFKYWVGFFILFILGFVGIMLGFEIYAHVTGKKYDQLLDQYKVNRH